MIPRAEGVNINSALVPRLLGLLPRRGRGQVRLELGDEGVFVSAAVLTGQELVDALLQQPLPGVAFVAGVDGIVQGTIGLGGFISPIASPIIRMLSPMAAANLAKMTLFQKLVSISTCRTTRLPDRLEMNQCWPT